MAEEFSIDTLKTVPLFAGLPEKALATIAQSGKVVMHAPGHAIVEEGNEGVGLHVVLSGSATVRNSTRELARLGPGGFFGEMALLQGGRRTATVTADTQVSTFSIASWELNSLLREIPDLEARLRHEMERRKDTAPD